MSGIKVSARGQYTYKADTDSRGMYWWIVDPSGNCIAYVDTLAMALSLINHLNRS